MQAQECATERGPQAAGALSPLGRSRPCAGTGPPVDRPSALLPRTAGDCKLPASLARATASFKCRLIASLLATLCTPNGCRGICSPKTAGRTGLQATGEASFLAASAWQWRASGASSVYKLRGEAPARRTADLFHLSLPFGEERYMTTCADCQLLLHPPKTPRRWSGTEQAVDRTYGRSAELIWLVRSATGGALASIGCPYNNSRTAGPQRREAVD